MVDPRVIHVMLADEEVKLSKQAKVLIDVSFD